jgi:hypothetical protein
MRCNCFNINKLMQRRKIFKKGIMKIGKECDLLSIMNQARRSKNFLKNYLTQEQKILQKFDSINLINASSSSGTDEIPSDID